MAMIRPLHPADVSSFLAFNRSACYGQHERCWEGGSSTRQLVRTLARTLALNTPYHNTWVYAHERSIRGLVTVRSRRGTAIWEVERLQGLPTEDVEEVLESLLDHLACIGGEEGIYKIFFRLPADSPLLAVARRAGFFPYTRERLFSGPPQPVRDAPSGLRPRRSFDYFALFQHYVRSVPMRVRQAEALTMQEWGWLDGWRPPRAVRLTFRRARRDFVIEEDESVRAWLRVDPTAQTVHLSAEPDYLSTEQVEEILAFGLGQMPPGQVVLLPVRDYQAAVAPAAEACALTAGGESTLTVKVLAARVHDHCLVPVGA